MKTEIVHGMKPILIIPPKTISPADITLLRENGICVVEATEPAKVKFLDPIPSAAGRTDVENAAIELSRLVLQPGTFDDSSRANISRMYVELLVKGTRLDPKPSSAEREREIFEIAKENELRRLAREEAKAERLATKMAKEQSKGVVK